MTTRRSPTLQALLAAGLLLLVQPGCPKEEARSHALQITSEDQLIGGPGALGEVGDWLMYNDQIELIVRGTGNSPGFGIRGGSLLDLDLVRGPEEFGGEGNDRFGELFPLVNFVYPNPKPDAEYTAIEVVADGADGGPAILRVEGERDKYIHILKLLADMLNGDERYFRIRTDYVLHPGARYVEIVTEVFVPEEIAEEQGFPTETTWIDLEDTTEPVNALQQLVNGVLPPIVAEAEDLENVGVDPRVVSSPSTDFEAAGVEPGHELKADLGDGTLGEVAIASVDGHELTLEEDLVLTGGGAYFRVLGDAGDSGTVFGDFFFMGGKVAFFMPDDQHPIRADWNGGLGPAIGFDYVGTILDVGHAGGSTFSDPMLVDFYAGAGDGVSYAYGTRDGLTSVPILLESFSVAFTHDSALQQVLVPGQGARFRRFLTVGEGDVASAVEVLWTEVRDEPVGAIEGFVLDGRTGEGVSGAAVLAFRDPDPGAGELPGRDQLAGPVLQFETDLYRDRVADGSFGGVLQPGDYLLIATGPGNVHSEMVRLTVEDGGAHRVTLVLPETGVVAFDVRDARDVNIPCKLTFHGHDGAGKPDPLLGEGYLPGDLAYLEWSSMGVGELEVAPGTYTVEISRGPEYDLDVHTFGVTPGTTTLLKGSIERVVDTTGWIAGDLHTHMQNSPDSGLLFQDRVESFLGEGVEYAVASDHDHLSNLQPVIEEMGATEYLKATVGDELTTAEMGHFNGFPLAYDPGAPEDGAPDWQVESKFDSSLSGDPLPHLTPGEIYDALRAAGRYAPEDTVVQNNHPRDGLLGNFYMYSVDLQTGEPTADGNALAMLHDVVVPEHFSYDFDAIEMSNGIHQELIRSPTIEEVRAFNEDGTGTIYSALARTVDEQEALRTGQTGLHGSYAGALDDWMNWLNQGNRYTATGNSDSHWQTDEAGVPRNYIRSSTDLPDFIDEREIAAAIQDGRVSHSYGPFIELWAEGDGGAGEIGDTVADDDGVVDLHIRVQSPTWFDVDRIEIYQNGVMICSIEGDHTCADPADNFGLFHPNEQVINFDGTVTIDLADYWMLSTPDDVPSLPPEHGLPVDSWFAVVAMGDDSTAPLARDATREPIRFSDILTGSLGAIRFEDMTSSLLSGIDISLGADFHKVFPIIPWGLTNAVFVDADGDGEWVAPGLPLYVTHHDWQAMEEAAP